MSSLLIHRDPEMCAAVYAFAQYSRYDQRQMMKVISLLFLSNSWTVFTGSADENAFSWDVSMTLTRRAGMCAGSRC